MANSKTQNLWVTFALAVPAIASVVAFVFLVFEMVFFTPDIAVLVRRLDWVPFIRMLPGFWPAMVPIFVAYLLMNVSVRLLVWHLSPGTSGSTSLSAKKFKDECPMGGRHQPYLAQEDGGNGQILYRSRCKKCRYIIGFGFEQIGHR